MEENNRREKIKQMMKMLEHRFNERRELLNLIDELSDDLYQAIAEKNAVQRTIDSLFEEIAQEELQIHKEKLENTEK